MANYRSIQRHIDKGRGHAGRVLGPPFDVYRVQDNLATNFLDPLNKVATRFPILRRVITGGPHLEGPDMGSLLYEMIADMTRFVTGDVFIERDPFYGVGGDAVNYATAQFNGIGLAFHAPIRKNIGARVNKVGIIIRSNETPDSDNYWSSDLRAGLPLQLSHGLFSLGDPGEIGALIPMGISASERFHGELIRDNPTSTDVTRWFAYLPVLHGYQIREGDRIAVLEEAGSTGDWTDVVNNGSRYIVVHPFEQETGLVGNFLVLERTGAPA